MQVIFLSGSRGDVEVDPKKILGVRPISDGAFNAEISLLGERNLKVKESAHEVIDLIEKVNAEDERAVTDEVNIVFDAGHARSFTDCIEAGNICSPATGWTEESLTVLAGACIAKVVALTLRRTDVDERELLRAEFPEASDAEIEQSR